MTGTQATSAIGLFREYSTAQGEARLRAGITGYRYKLAYDRTSRCWCIFRTNRRFIKFED